MPRTFARTIRALTAAAALAVMSAPMALSQPMNLRFTTGEAGGIFFIQAGGISEIIRRVHPDAQINAFPGGALGNIGVVSNGVADIGLTHIYMYPMALRGETPFTQSFDNVAAIMAHGYYSYGQVIVSEASGITSFEQIRDTRPRLRINTTSASGASYWLTRWILESYGVTFDDINSWGGEVLFGNFNDAVSWFRDGQIDAWGGGGHLPSNAPLQISQFNSVRLLGMADEQLQATIERIPGLEARTIPAGTYTEMVNANEEVRTIAGMGGIIVRRDMPDDVVYDITKALIENEDAMRAIPGMEEFVAENAWRNIGPIHPGAERYYRERGWIQ